MKVESRREIIKKGAMGLGVLFFPSPEPVDCPVYMFHETSSSAVEQVIDRNRSQGRTPITVGELGQKILEGGDTKNRYFALTFDDRLRTHYTVVRPLLNRLETNATFFMMAPGWQGDGVHSYLTDNQMREMSDEGFEIGSHCIQHPPNLIQLRQRDYGSYLAQIYESKTLLEQWLQKSVLSFSSPSSVYDARVLEDVENAGYMIAVRTAADPNKAITRHTSQNIFKIDRIRIN